MTNVKKLFSWEDTTLAVLVFLWVAIGGGITVLHLYTVGFMGLILLVGLSKGLWPALARTAILSAVMLLTGRFKTVPHMIHLANVASMMSCAVLAGFLGDRQRKAQEALKRSFSETLEGLARVLEARDPYTQGHSMRASEIALMIAQGMEVDKKAQLAIQQAGILHDLGKIGTPDGILRKNESLTLAEKKTMHEHPVIGHQILKGIGFLQEAAVLVRHHHERYDGSGYPDGLAGSAIPLGARILAVADALDALTTDRPYHKAISYDEAVQELAKEAGRQFDPVVFDALKRCYRSPST
ncbi:MAG: hypothetical protein A2992_08205 [Elusimicrobia bacterium RIFCSPLOWO2_01_FULL_59_12]|nr:MAG: hypothetical protein A2992_08205 [Elusimicrobia bacterium RIFCSPLOWO2_01_FULL_59_12]